MYIGFQKGKMQLFRTSNCKNTLQILESFNKNCNCKNLKQPIEKLR